MAEVFNLRRMIRKRTSFNGLLQSLDKSLSYSVETCLTCNESDNFCSMLEFPDSQAIWRCWKHLENKVKRSQVPVVEMKIPRLKGRRQSAVKMEDFKALGTSKCDVSECLHHLPSCVLSAGHSWRGEQPSREIHVHLFCACAEAEKWDSSCLNENLQQSVCITRKGKWAGRGRDFQILCKHEKAE